MSDYISRQAAIDALKEIYEWHDNVTKERIIEHFERLPSAQPEPCDDAVSRKDATKELFMSMIIKSPEFGDMLTSEERSYNSGLREAAKIIKKLPSVTLKPQECKDTISRQAAIDVIKTSRCLANALKKTMKLPSAQPERLTDDDFETIRIHLNAFKEKLCNQGRWEEAREYQRIIDRFMIFASAQSDSYIVGLKTLDAMIRAAYRAGKEGRPLMVALNEEVTT